MITVATLGYGRKGFTEAQRVAILDDATCYYCGALDPSEVDHVMPFSRGGSDGPDNLVPACRRCNRDKSDMTMSEWEIDRAYRGAAWPPPSPLAMVADLVAGVPARRYDHVDTPGDWFDAVVRYLDDVHRNGGSVEGLAHAVDALLKVAA